MAVPAGLAPMSAGAALLALSGLHLAWGFGATTPFASVEGLSDAVLGHSAPGERFVEPPACFAVAAALAAAASLVLDRPPWARPLRQSGLVALTGILGARAALGFAGRTDVLVPGSTSERFRRNDRRLFAPLCLALAAGAAKARRS